MVITTYSISKTSWREKNFFFFVRDPIDRFVSGFYSRQRQGRPRYNTPWTDDEKTAFRFFEKPNDLALALSDKNENIRTEAIKAMQSIFHVKSFYWDWFHSPDYFLSRINDIVFIGSQKKLNEDFVDLKKILKIPERFKLPMDEVSMHKNPEQLDKSLEPQAFNNLRDWYSRDYDFLEMLKEKKLLSSLEII